ncbi:IMPACT family protein [Luteimonas chenhongjianii]|uniref:IMPACT family protein n=1 Tax=Luteimonas chenhongjianii TaxID=2006110 RepID=A0A290XFC4_9GAMM|nr:YigZ family protein [Luteimonas chenhongjianii]ATD67840.1 IMPACT family protein [Luteimonas chenhongjianii]
MALDTLAAPASHTLEVKHSRFVAHAAPVDDADGAAAFMQRVHVADATHNCWAWRVGDQYRSSDDGEPAGTAGRPILAAIDGQGFDRVAVVVVRWYGGIKLGAGGLVRAYGGCAAECLRTAPRLRLVELATLQLHAPFDALGSVHAALPGAHAVKLEERFDADGVTLQLQLPADRVDDLRIRLRDATRNRVRIDDNG